MKKILLILTSILLSIYILLSLISLGDGYHAERSLWKIDLKLNYIAAHNESTPDFTIDQLAHTYRDFINKYSKTIYAKQAELMLGNLYALRKNYSQARLEYQKAVCPDKDLSAQAEVTIAKTYELENNNAEALKIYKNVIQNYPLTSSGFFLPIYLTNHLLPSEDQMEYVNAAYYNALVFYRKIAAEHPKSKLEFNALRMVAVCQLNQKDYEGTVKTMGQIILKYPVGKALQEGVNGINVLCVTKLHNYDMAINIYSQFIQKYPGHSADPLLKKMIKDLQVLKDKKLVIRTAPKPAVK
jgi:TolA-binding protein